MSDERMSLLSLPLWTWLVGLVLLAGAVVWWIQPEDPGVPKPLGQVRITLAGHGLHNVFQPVRDVVSGSQPRQN